MVLMAWLLLLTMRSKSTRLPDLLIVSCRLRMRVTKATHPIFPHRPNKTWKTRWASMKVFEFQILFSLLIRNRRKNYASPFFRLSRYLNGELCRLTVAIMNPLTRENLGLFICGIGHLLNQPLYCYLFFCLQNRGVRKIISRFLNVI